MYDDVEHKTLDEIASFVTFSQNTAFQETTQTTSLQFAYGKIPATMIDAMLPYVEEDGLKAEYKNTYNLRRRPASLLGYVQLICRSQTRDATPFVAETPSFVQEIGCGFGPQSGHAVRAKRFCDGISEHKKFNFFRNFSTRLSATVIHDGARGPRLFVWFSSSLASQDD